MNALLRYCVIALVCLLLVGCRTSKVIEQVPVEVEKRLHWWQKGLVWMGVIGLVCLVGWVIIRIKN